MLPHNMNMTTKETDYFKVHFISLGKDKKIMILDNSPLTERESELIYNRFIKGLSLKECAELYGVEINSLSKHQHSIIKKLYPYLLTL